MELIRGIATSPARQTIIACVMEMARELDVAVIAEGIETEAELTALRAAGITLFQGYQFAKPAIASLPAVQFPAPNNTILMKAASQHRRPASKQ
jgi:EAL domain-containing protein (putative c-di-GMP-specific phosphodiesterase class I)